MDFARWSGVALGNCGRLRRRFGLSGFGYVIPPLQGGNRMTGKTQGVALGYRIRPRWGRNSRACVGGQACVCGGSGVRAWGWDGLVCNGPNGARGDSPGQRPGVIRRIAVALKGRNGFCPVVRCRPG
jgi:hypothetical protein